MASLFEKVVSVSIIANWLILAVILLRLLLKKAPKWITCLLWAVVAVRLICPFSIESPVSLVPETTSAIQEAVDTNLIHPEAAPSQTAVTLTQQETPDSHPGSNSFASLTPLVWGIGVLLMLGYLTLSYLKMRRLVREAVWEKENIWICDAVPTPFILGIIRPKIYLPSGLPERNREYVIAHEQSHLRCKDHWWKPMAFLLLAVFWFDPLMWIAYPLVCRDIEFACDERVIRHYGLSGKKAYSEALLACSSNRKLVLACPIAFGETAVVQRIRNVLNYKKPRFWIILVSVIVIAITAVGFLTVPRKDVSVPQYEQYCTMNQQIEIMSGINENRQADSVVEVIFQKASGPSMVQLELWCKAESGAEWMVGTTADLDLAGNAFFVIPSGCNTYSIMATAVEGKSGYATFIVSEPIPKPIDEEVIESTESFTIEEWDRYPDGIRIETYTGETFTGHVMIVRDPSSIYLAASSDPLSKDTPGIRPEQAMARENALAAVNAGRFFDDGSASQAVGSVPLGLVLAGSRVIWNDDPVFEKSFVGFNQDNILIVASSMTEAEAKDLKIRDGCTSGPVLMINGEPNREVIDDNSGYNPRTAIGQRADGAVIFVCADGRSAESLGATNADILDILTQYGVVNACALAGGAASVMYYRDTDGRYGEAGQVQMVNNYALPQGQPRRMPAYWMVKP